MLTLKRKGRRRVPPQRGRGAILGLFFCCAQCNISAVAMSTRSAVFCGVTLARSKRQCSRAFPGCAMLVTTAVGELAEVVL